MKQSDRWRKRDIKHEEEKKARLTERKCGKKNQREREKEWQRNKEGEIKIYFVKFR